MSELHDELEREFADVEQQLVDPELVKDRSLYAQVTRRYKELGAIVACITDLGTAEQDVADSKEMHRESSGEDRVLWAEEISLAEATAADAAYRLDELLIPKDPNDGRNVIVEIRGAEGGKKRTCSPATCSRCTAVTHQRSRGVKRRSRQTILIWAASRP